MEREENTETDETPVTGTEIKNITMCPYCGGPAIVDLDYPEEMTEFNEEFPMVCQRCHTLYHLLVSEEEAEILRRTTEQTS